MYRIQTELTGLAPFLYNRIAADALDGTTGKKRDPAAAVEAKLYRAADRTLILPQWNLKRVLLDGAIKLKTKVAKTSLTDLVSACVFVDGDPSFGVKEPDAIHPCVGRVPPRRGAAVLIRRPLLNQGWKLRVLFAVTNDVIPLTQVKAALDVAGLLVGMGSWRPQFGRFEVSQFEQV